jgi:hypothetical protein
LNISSSPFSPFEGVKNAQENMDKAMQHVVAYTEETLAQNPEADRFVSRFSEKPLTRATSNAGEPEPLISRIFNMQFAKIGWQAAQAVLKTWLDMLRESINMLGR